MNDLNDDDFDRWLKDAQQRITRDEFEAGVDQLERIGLPIPKWHWGRGPWQREPDEAHWQHAGFRCFAWRHLTLGSWCGYVGVTSEHPLFGVTLRECLLGTCTPEPPDEFSKPDDTPEYDCDHTPQRLFEAHYGDINFADVFAGSPVEFLHYWWFGFHCGRTFDYMPHMDTFERLAFPPELRVMRQRIDEHCARLGFGTFVRYRTLRYVRRETNRLAEQLRVRPDHAGRWPWPTRLAMVLDL